MTMVTLPKKPRRERKKAAARQHIIETAIELFSRHGLAGVTVDHIADVADIGKGTIYNYFKTKEDIVVAFMAGLEQQVQVEAQRYKAARGSLQSILSGFIRLQFRLKQPYHQFVRVFLGQMFVHTENFLPYMVEMQRFIDPPLESLFLALQERRLMRSDIEIPGLILVFKTIHLGLTALWSIEGPPFVATEKALKLEMMLFCEGLKART